MIIFRGKPLSEENSIHRRISNMVRNIIETYTIQDGIIIERGKYLNINMKEYNSLIDSIKTQITKYIQ